VDGVLRPTQLAGTLLDVTERRAVQAQLMQSDRLASVGMLAAGVAHEINNPLAYLTAALDFLHEQTGAISAPDALRRELIQALADARDGAERVRHVVRDLRAFSGVRDERRTRVELAQVLDAAIHVAGNELRYRARVVREYGAAPAVRADEARLGQVALNLLINAAQAIPEGHGAAHEVRVVITTDGAGRAVFEIRDTGSGIPASIVDQIFDPFFTTKPRGIGTGLGLSICRGIVQALGGEISVESRVGQGTTFRVALPPAAPATTGPETPAPAAASRRRGRVLVVDDEPPVAAAIRRVLAPGHDVVVCGSAREALDAVKGGERFDAILCDLMMPEMTGMELHDALARLAPDQAKRFVVLTGGAFTESARSFLDRVPLPCCEKPFDSRDLRELVGKVVG
jgi:nitrogen-specific signal transduction histidine kinase/CheY-like chemotaxis protein